MESKYKRLRKYVVVRSDNNTIAPFLYSDKEQAQKVSEVLSKAHKELSLEYVVRKASIVFEM